MSPPAPLSTEGLGLPLALEVGDTFEVGEGCPISAAVLEQESLSFAGEGDSLCQSSHQLGPTYGVTSW